MNIQVRFLYRIYVLFLDENYVQNVRIPGSGEKLIKNYEDLDNIFY